jgi:hypothetical protein
VLSLSKNFLCCLTRISTKWEEKCRHTSRIRYGSTFVNKKKKFRGLQWIIQEDRVERGEGSLKSLLLLPVRLNPSTVPTLTFWSPCDRSFSCKVVWYGVEKICTDKKGTMCYLSSTHVFQLQSWFWLSFSTTVPLLSGKKYALINHALSSYVYGNMIASISTFEKKTCFHKPYNEDYATDKHLLSCILISYD